MLVNSQFIDAMGVWSWLNIKGYWISTRLIYITSTEQCVLFFIDTFRDQKVLCHWCVYMLSHSVVSDLCNPKGCSPPGFSVHGIFQTRILEQFAISCSRGTFQPRDRTWLSLLHWQADSSPLCHLGSPRYNSLICT